jgi:hypothetical protein
MAWPAAGTGSLQAERAPAPAGCILDPATNSEQAGAALASAARGADAAGSQGRCGRWGWEGMAQQALAHELIMVLVAPELHCM